MIPYIMCSTLGKNGRLGNQMFQYALLVGIAKRTGHRIAIPTHQRHKDSKLNLQIDEVFSIDENSSLGIIPQKTIKEPPLDLRYLKEIENISISDGNVDVFGYFQTERYFLHTEIEIQKAFRFRNTKIESETKCLFDTESKKFYSSSRKTIAVHVRRGDYLNFPDHHPFSSKYYLEALRYITSRIGQCHVVVISDDIPWCENFFQKYNEFGTYTFSTGSQEKDLAILRYSDHCIISNSSFGWWGAWLNQTPGKIVVAPSPWFGPKGPKYHDLYVNGWVILDAK